MEAAGNRPCAATVPKRHCRAQADETMKTTGAFRPRSPLLALATQMRGEPHPPRHLPRMASRQESDGNIRFCDGFWMGAADGSEPRHGLCGPAWTLAPKAARNGLACSKSVAASATTTAPAAALRPAFMPSRGSSALSKQYVDLPESAGPPLRPAARPPWRHGRSRRRADAARRAST